MRTLGTQWLIRLLILLSIALIVTIVVRTNIVRGQAGRFFGFLERPLLVASDELSEGGEVVFSSRGELIEQLREREEQVLELAITAAEWEDQARLAQEAMLLLEYSESAGLDILPAKVIMRMQQGARKEVLINIGALDGVSNGDAVVYEEGILYGVVEEAQSHVSNVIEVTDDRSSVGVTLPGLNETIGIANGDNGPLVSIDFVPQETEIKVNDLLVTSGIDSGIPAGLAVGIVNSVERDPSEPFVSVFVEPLATRSRVRMLGVVNVVEYE